ncbi:hypothetical protein QT23_00060, partial [Staphylococcus aureus]
HEHRRRRRIEPQEGQPRPHHRAAEDRQVARAGHVRDAQIDRVDLVAGQIGDQHERHAGDHHRHGGEAVEPVGEVHCIAERHDHEGGEGDVEPADVRMDPAEEGHIELGAVLRADDPGGDARDQELAQQPHPAR